jgi:hypothetical protein
MMSDPGRDASDDQLGVVLAEYWLRADRGERIDRQSFLAQHADRAGELAEYFECSDALGRFAAPPAGPPRPEHAAPPAPCPPAGRR